MRLLAVRPFLRHMLGCSDMTRPRLDTLRLCSGAALLSSSLSSLLGKCSEVNTTLIGTDAKGVPSNNRTAAAARV